MMDITLLIGYPTVFLLGLVSGHWLCCRIVGSQSSICTMLPDPPHRHRGGLSNQAILIGAVVAVLLALGVYMTTTVTEKAAERLAAERTEVLRAQNSCINRWGDQVLDAIEARTAANRRLEEATLQRAKAFDRVIRISVLLRRDPPKSNEITLTSALEQADQAGKNLAEVRDEVARTREANQYPPPPTLACDPE